MKGERRWKAMERRIGCKGQIENDDGELNQRNW